MRYNEAFMAARARSELVKHFDANETAFLERQLTFVRQKTFEVSYAELLGRRFMPIATDIPASATTYVYFVYDQTGKAKVIAPGVTDLPRVDVVKSEITGNVKGLGLSYGWEINEMREAARTGTPLGDMKAKAARRAAESLIDKMLFDGKDHDGQSYGVTGIANNTDVAGSADANVVNPSTDPWSLANSDPSDILNDMASWVSTIVNANQQRWIPDTLLLAPAEFSLIAQKRVSDLSDVTILQAFLRMNPYIRNVDQWYRLTAAGGSGKNRQIVYKRDPEVLEGVVPQEFEQLPPQAEGLEFIVPCLARCGAVKIYHPEAMVYVDSTASTA